MFGSLSEVLAILEHYKYLVIFPIAVVEGPIIIIISGLLVSLGFLNGFLAYTILVIADVIGDCLYYSIGKYGRNSGLFKKYAKFLGYDEKSEVFLENHFQRHRLKTFLVAKISHGMGGAVQISAGIARVGFWEFLRFSILGTIPKALVLLFLGFYLGKYYMKIDGYLHYIAGTTLSVALLVLLYFLSRRLANKFFGKSE